MPFGFPAFIKEIFKNLAMASKMFLFLLLFLFISKQVCILADLSILNRFLKEIVIAKWFLGFLFLLNPWRPLPSSESFPWEIEHSWRPCPHRCSPERILLHPAAVRTLCGHGLWADDRTGYVPVRFCLLCLRTLSLSLRWILLETVNQWQLLGCAIYVFLRWTAFDCQCHSS